MPNPIDRRDFLKTGFATTSALAAGTASSALAAAQTILSPRHAQIHQEQLRIGVIGTTGLDHQQRSLLSKERVVAWCEVNGSATNSPSDDAFAHARYFSDFRALIDDDALDLDCVVAAVAVARGRRDGLQAIEVRQPRALQAERAVAARHVGAARERAEGDRRPPERLRPRARQGTLGRPTG